MCGLNLHATLELITDCRTVTAMACITQKNDRSIFQNGSQDLFCGLNLLYTLELILNCRTVTAKVCITPCNDESISCPACLQQYKKALKWKKRKGARSISSFSCIAVDTRDKICELSPPWSARPQVATNPSSRITAKASPVA